MHHALLSFPYSGVHNRLMRPDHYSSIPAAQPPLPPATGCVAVHNTAPALCRSMVSGHWCDTGQPGGSTSHLWVNTAACSTHPSTQGDLHMTPTTFANTCTAPALYAQSSLPYWSPRRQYCQPCARNQQHSSLLHTPLHPRGPAHDPTTALTLLRWPWHAPHSSLPRGLPCPLPPLPTHAQHPLCASRSRVCYHPGAWAAVPATCESTQQRVQTALHQSGPHDPFHLCSIKHSTGSVCI
jgi:hypothetical protein